MLYSEYAEKCKIKANSEVVSKYDLRNMKVLATEMGFHRAADYFESKDYWEDLERAKIASSENDNIDYCTQKRGSDEKRPNKRPCPFYSFNELIEYIDVYKGTQCQLEMRALLHEYLQSEDALLSRSESIVRVNK